MFFTIYILTNRERTTFYVGVTGVLAECIFDHKAHISKRTECWRHCTRLVYFEDIEYFDEAISRLDALTFQMERFQTDFIGRFNPCWVDLSMDWYDPDELSFYKRIYSPLIQVAWQ